MVVQQRRRRLRRSAVVELQRAEPALDGVRRRERAELAGCDRGVRDGHGCSCVVGSNSPTLPGLVEERLQWAVQAEDGEESLVGVGLDPVAVGDAGGLFGADVDGGRAVRVGHRGRRRVGLAAGAGVALRGDQHRAGLVVVEGERPEAGLGDVGRQRHRVRLGPVEVVLVGVHEGDEVLGADAGEAHRHRRRDPGVAVEEQGAQVVLAGPGRRVRLDALRRHLRDRAIELVAALEQQVGPRRVRVPVHVLLTAGVEHQRPRRGVADGGGLVEDATHPLVGVERLALDDAELAEMSDDLHVTGVGRLLLQQGVDGLEEPGVGRRDRVERRAGALHERRLGHLGGRRERHPPLEEGGDAGSRATRRVRVDLQRGLDRRHRRGGVVVLDERPAEHQRPVGA